MGVVGSEMHVGNFKSYRAANTDKYLQHYFVNRRNFNCPHMCVYRVHYFIFWGRGEWGF
jgi:hypothetical protein